MINKETYKRFTEKRKGKNVIPLLNSACGVDLPKWMLAEESDIRWYLSGDAVDKLANLEDKIMDGTLIETKYPLYSIVFIIDYINEKGYSVYGGKPIVRECFVTSITQIIKEEGKLLYRVQPKDLPNDVLEGEVEHCEYWERAWWEKDLFLTKAEAKARLKELQEKQE